MSNFVLIKGEKFTTPVAKFQYPKLVEPDTKFHPEGMYEVIAVMDASDPEAIRLAEDLDKFLEQHKASLKAQASATKFKLTDLPWRFEEIDGMPALILKAKSKASGVDRDGKSWARKPALFDAKGNPVTDRYAVAGLWSGTTGKVAFQASPFYTPVIGAGVTLRLQAVQIINLVESGGSGSAHGFGEEKGWTPKGATTTEPAAVPWDAEPIAADEADF